MKETIYAKFWMADGILIFIYKPIVFLDYPIAKTIVDDRLCYQQETSCPALCDLQGIHNSDKAARDYLANEGSALLKAVALVDKRAVARAFLPVYLERNRPLVPTQVFYDQEDAIEYLKAYR